MEVVSLKQEDLKKESNTSLRSPIRRTTDAGQQTNKIRLEMGGGAQLTIEAYDLYL